jgi:hypothetical protein
MLQNVPKINGRSLTLRGAGAATEKTGNKKQKTPMIQDDHLKGYHCWYSKEEHRNRNRGFNMLGQPVFVNLPIYTIRTPDGKTIRSQVTSVATYFREHLHPGKYLGKIVS